MSRKELTKAFSLLVCLMLVLVLFIGCSTTAQSSGGPKQTDDQKSTAGSTEKTKYAEYTIEALFPGDTPNGFDQVLAEAESRLADTLNVKLDFQFIPWADYKQKIQVKIAAGDEFDLHLNAPWLNMNDLIADKAIQPLDDLIASYAPAIQKGFEKQVIQSNLFDGKIYGLPLGDVLGGEYKSLIIIRKDLREKYGMGEITTVDSFVDYLRKVKENEPGMIPILWKGSTWVYSRWYWGMNRGFKMLNTNTCPIYVFFDKDTVQPVKPIYQDAKYLEWLDFAHKLYQEGLIYSDILTVKDDEQQFMAGKTAAIYSDGGPSNPSKYSPTLQSNFPDAKVELIEFEGKNVKILSDFQVWNFEVLNSKSKDPERVMRFLNWIFEDQANYDLLVYGIEGKHWVNKGEGLYGYPEGIDLASNYSFPSYVLCMNVNYERISANAIDDEIFWKSYLQDINNFVQSPLTGFVYKTDNVEAEIAKVSAIWPEVIFPIENGILSADQALQGAIDQLNAAGYDKILEDAQKQINDFLAGK